MPHPAALALRLIPHTRDPAEAIGRDRGHGAFTAADAAWMLRSTSECACSAFLWRYTRDAIGWRTAHLALQLYGHERRRRERWRVSDAEIERLVQLALAEEQSQLPTPETRAHVFGVPVDDWRRRFSVPYEALRAEFERWVYDATAQCRRNLDDE